MTTPSVTLRSLKNEDTGIDISVPNFKEEEAPLGGISILYEISVFTRLDLFKTRLHKSGDVVHFTIFKAYREIEDLYNKLSKKYPKVGLPPVPKASSAGKYTSDEKVEALDMFMSAIAKSIEICYSSTFTQFIGINSQRLPSFSLPNTDESEISAETIKDNKLIENSEELPNSTEVFSKVKKYATDKSQSVPPTVKNVDLFEEVKLTKETELYTQSGLKGSTSQGLFDDFEDDSLFTSKPQEKTPAAKPEEKVKEKEVVIKPEAPKRKERKSPPLNIDDSQIIIKDRKPGDLSLFQEQDFGEFITKDEEALFLVTPTSSENKKNTMLFFEEEIFSPETDDSVDENLDDLLNLEPLPDSTITAPNDMDEILFETKTSEPEQHKPVPVPRPRKKSLVKSEVDSEKKPEIVSEKKQELDSVKKQELDSEKKQEPDSEKKQELDSEKKQELDFEKKQELDFEKKQELDSEKKQELDSEKKQELDSKKKPEVMPRRVFLNKEKVAPPTAVRPPVPAKPLQTSTTATHSKLPPPTKPKPPPKKPKPIHQGETTKRDLDAENANESKKSENMNTVTDLASDLKELDILKYIEQEEKSLDTNLSLFD